MSELKLPYPRPLSLSDPCNDHGPEILRSLLSTADQDLGWRDYERLFCPGVPAGTYEETAYFLSFAFKHILSHKDVLDLVTPLVWFASEYASQLRHDGVLDAVRGKLKQCLEYWASQFTVDHYDRDACQEKGWSCPYEDLVRNQELLMEATGDLLRYKAHGDLAVAFFTDLASSESDPIKSAWFLESVRAYLSGDVYRPRKHLEIRQLLDDEELALRHANTVRQQLIGFDSEPTYWDDTFNALGLV